VHTLENPDVGIIYIFVFFLLHL